MFFELQGVRAKLIQHVILTNRSQVGVMVIIYIRRVDTLFDCVAIPAIFWASFAVS